MALKDDESFARMILAWEGEEVKLQHGQYFVSVCIYCCLNTIYVFTCWSCKRYENGTAQL